VNRAELRSLAASVRGVIHELLKQKASDKSSYSEYGDAEDFEGACGCASWALWQVLPNSVLVLGKWADCGTHCWLEYEDYLIDITASQFGLSPIRVLLKRGKSASKYKMDQRNREVVEALDSWYPNNWKSEISSLLRNHGLLEQRAA